MKFRQVREFSWHDAKPIWKFVVEGKPATAGSKVAIRRKDGGVFMKDMSGKHGTAWRKAVKIAATRAMNGADPIPSDVAVGIAVEFVFPYPKKHLAKDGTLRTDAPLLKITAPDCDKMQRALGDAMKGVVYEDDAQIAVWNVRKTLGQGDGFAGCTIVEVYRINDPPVE